MSFNSAKGPSRSNSPLTPSSNKDSIESESTTTRKTKQVYERQQMVETTSSWAVFKTKFFSLFSLTSDVYENYTAENWQEMVDSSCGFSLMWNHIEGKIDAQIAELSPQKIGKKQEKHATFLSGFYRFVSGLYDPEPLKERLRWKIGTLRNLESKIKGKDPVFAFDLAAEEFLFTPPKKETGDDLLDLSKKKLTSKQKELLRSLKIKDIQTFVNNGIRYTKLLQKNSEQIPSQTIVNNLIDFTIKSPEEQEKTLKELEEPSNQQALIQKSAEEKKTLPFANPEALSLNPNYTQKLLQTAANYSEKIKNGIEHILKLNPEFSEEDSNLLSQMWFSAFLLSGYSSNASLSLSTIKSISNQFNAASLQKINKKLEIALQKNTANQIMLLSDSSAVKMRSVEQIDPNLHQKLQNMEFFLNKIMQILLDSNNKSFSINLKILMKKSDDFYHLSPTEQTKILERMTNSNQTDRALIADNFKGSKSNFFSISAQELNRLMHGAVNFSENTIDKFIANCTKEEANDVIGFPITNLIPVSFSVFFFQELLVNSGREFRNRGYESIENLGANAEQLTNKVNAGVDSILDKLIEAAASALTPFLYTGAYDDIADDELEDVSSICTEHNSLIADLNHQIQKLEAKIRQAKENKESPIKPVGTKKIKKQEIQALEETLVGLKKRLKTALTEEISLSKKIEEQEPIVSLFSIMTNYWNKWMES